MNKDVLPQPPKGWPTPVERRDKDYFMEWSEKVILALLLIILIITGFLFWIVFSTEQTVGDSKKAADNAAAQTIINRETGLRNRGVSCSNLRALVPDRYASYAPCQDPAIQQYILGS